MTTRARRRRQSGGFGRTGRRDWLWGVAILIVGIAVVASIFLVVSKDSGPNQPDIAGLPCERGEKLNYHVHSFLAVFVEGQQVQVPANIGINVQERCYFWLHTHDASGIVHVEAPQQRDFTLGQFFAIWDRQLSATQLLNKTVDAGHQIKVTVNGVEVSGDPSQIKLQDKISIVVQYGPPFATPPSYNFGG